MIHIPQKLTLLGACPHTRISETKNSMDGHFFFISTKEEDGKYRILNYSSLISSIFNARILEHTCKILQYCWKHIVAFVFQRFSGNIRFVVKKTHREFILENM